MAAVPEELEHDLESAYRAHFPLLYRRARRWLPPDEAEDLVQETFLRAWTHHAGTNPGVPWLLTVLRNLAIDRSRKKAPVLVDDVATLETPSFEDASDNVVRLEEQRRVRDAVATLTDAQQQVIRLREWGGMSQQEIADNLGTTVPSVESLLQRGRRQLRKSLDHAMGVLLFPATGLWRKLRGIEGLTGSPQGVTGLSATVANLATAAAVIVAGASTPLVTEAEPAAPIERSAIGAAAPHGPLIVSEPKHTSDPAVQTPEQDASTTGASTQSVASPASPQHSSPSSGGSQAGGSTTGGSTTDTAAPAAPDVTPSSGGKSGKDSGLGAGDDDGPGTNGGAAAPPQGSDDPSAPPADVSTPKVGRVNGGLVAAPEASITGASS